MHDGSNWGDTIELKVISNTGEVKRWIRAGGEVSIDILEILRRLSVAAGNLAGK